MRGIDVDLAVEFIRGYPLHGSIYLYPERMGDPTYIGRSVAEAARRGTMKIYRTKSGFVATTLERAPHPAWEPVDAEQWRAAVARFKEKRDEASAPENSR